ncbi:unnamed protein product, partial [Closterium sp. Naga37s-1]
CHMQPSQAAASVSVAVRVGTVMVIDGRPITFSSRCANIPSNGGAVPSQVHQGSDPSKAACSAIRFFQDLGCTGQELASFTNGMS